MDPYTASPLPVASAVSSVEMPISTGSHFDIPPRNVRLACDRCHSQKLRCVREAKQPSCQRCWKLKTRCKFSPRASRVSLKPNVSKNLPLELGCANNNLMLTPNAETAMVNHQALIELDLVPTTICTDIPDIDHSLLLNPLDPAAVNNYWTSLPSPHESIIETSTLHMSMIGKIALLNVALYECSMELPSTPNSTISHTTNVRIPQTRRIFAFDKLFNLTTEFIHISNYHSMDEATMLMLLSCHCRLTEIYVSIFQLMQACVKHSLLPDMNNDWITVLPQLQVGSFAPPPVQVDSNKLLSSEISLMYIFTITLVSSQLWGNLEDLLRMRGGISDTFEVKIWESMKEKTRYMRQTISCTKQLLHRHSGAV